MRIVIYTFIITAFFISCNNVDMQYLAQKVKHQPTINNTNDSAWESSGFEPIKNLQRGKSYFKDSTDLNAKFKMLNI